MSNLEQARDDAATVKVLEAEIERLRGLLEEAREGLVLAKHRVESWPLGDVTTCMCGSEIGSHTLASGHAPRSQHDYATAEIIKDIDTTLTKIGEPR